MRTLGTILGLCVQLALVTVTAGQEQRVPRQEQSSEAEMRRLIENLSARVEALEQRLGPPTRPKTAEMQKGQSAILPFQDFLTGPARAMAFDDTGLVAVVDGDSQLTILRRSIDHWKQVSKSKLDAGGVPNLLWNDLDGDGTSELLVCADKINVFTLQDDNVVLRWSSRESFPCDETVPSAKIGVADFNGDGRKDFAVLNYKRRNHATDDSLHTLNVYSRTLSVPLDFGLTDTLTITDHAGYHSTSGFALADFTGDDRPELAIGNSNGHVWLVSFETGHPVIRGHWRTPAGGAVGTGLGAGNLDRDPQAELLVGTNGGDIYVLNVDDTFEMRIAAKAYSGRLAYGIASGDLDGDGIDELVVTRGHLGYAGMSRGQVVAEVWSLQDSTLQLCWQHMTVDRALPIVRDFDGDKRNEIIVISREKEGGAILSPKWTKASK